MPTVASLSLILRADSRPLQRDIRTAQRRINRQFNQFNRRLDQQARRAVRVAAFAVVGIVAAATREFVQLERAQQRITALVGVSQDQLGAWGDDLRRIGREVGVGPQALLEALFDITSAGIQGGKAIEVLEASARASAIGLGEVKTIADLATSAMNAYGSANVSAIGAVDTLIEAVRLGKLAPETLAAALGRILPIAAALNVSLGEVSGAIAAMSRTGTTAEEAVTQLRSVMTALLKPSVQAQQAFARLGTSALGVRDAVRRNGLVDTLLDLREQLGGTNDSLVEIFPNVRAIAGLFDLFGSGIEGNIQIIREMADSTGVLNEAFAQVAGSFSNFTSRVVALGQSLLVGLGGRVIEDVVSRFDSMEDAFAAIERGGERLADSILVLVDALLSFSRWIYDNRVAIRNLVAAIVALRVAAFGAALVANIGAAVTILRAWTFAVAGAGAATAALAASWAAIAIAAGNVVYQVGRLTNAISLYRRESNLLTESLAERDRVRARLNERLAETALRLEQIAAGDDAGSEFRIAG